MFRFLNNSACWLLSAVLLLTNGLPLAVQHAHEVGDDLVRHSHRFDRLFLAEAPPAVSAAESTVAAVTDHVHLLWFGWELTFPPAKGDRSVPAPSISGGGLLAKVDTRDGAAHEVVCPILSLVSPRWFDAAELSNHTNHSMQPRSLAALPLCETARHLRSGVQLI